MEDEDDRKESMNEIKVLFKKIKVCEKMIVKQKAYQTLLDEIVLLLTPHLEQIH